MIDEEKIRPEEKFDGIWVLRTNAGLEPTDVALRYKQLWMIERLFRHAKNLLRPVFHRTDAAICGHVFCSFLALALKRDLLGRMEKAGIKAEWDNVLRDLRALGETVVTYEASDRPCAAGPSVLPVRSSSAYGYGFPLSYAGSAAR